MLYTVVSRYGQYKFVVAEITYDVLIHIIDVVCKNQIDTTASMSVMINFSFPQEKRGILIPDTLLKARATRCNFFSQVSADNSAEEADRIETNGTATMCSTAIFSPHVFAENRQLLHVKSQ